MKKNVFNALSLRLTISLAVLLTLSFVPLLMVAFGLGDNLAVIEAVTVIEVATVVFLFKSVGRRTFGRVRELNETLGVLSAGEIPKKLNGNSEDEFAEASRSVNNISERISSAASFATRIGNGELNVSYDEQFNGDVLARSLQTMHEKLKAADEDNAKRNWVNTGLANFGELLRNRETDIQALSQKVISMLVKYLEANQGQLYIVVNEDEEQYLELSATYAWERTKFLNRKIAPGEGLAGQVWLEKQTTYLKEIPSDYIRITSGLGAASPNTLLIVPMKLNEEIFGILEIASFKSIRQHQILFVERVGELIASSLSTARINERTQKLLAESQSQTEELRAQEEEMRQNMEELTATQEEMHRKDVQLSAQLAAIDNSMATIEFTMDGLVVMANEKFMQTTGYTLNEIQHRHHRMFVGEEYASSEEYKSFWRSLNAGKSQTGEFKRVHKSGKELWISASYTIVVGPSGIPEKVIKFAIDITDQKLKALDFEGQIGAVNNTMASIEFTLDGTIVCANKKFLTAMGYTLHEIQGRHHRMFVDEATANARSYESFWQNLRDGHAQTGEFKRIAKGGREIWISASYTPIRNASGQVYKVIKFAQDITAQKAQSIDFEGQINAIRRSNAVIEFDMEGNILFANDLFLSALGYTTSDEVIGKHHRIFVPEFEAKSADYKKFWSRLKNVEYFTGEFKRQKRNGESIWIYGSYNPILNSDGIPYKVVKYAHVVNKSEQEVTSGGREVTLL